MATYSTRTEAIQHEIIDVIEAGDATAAEFDIEAIADQVLADYDDGYAVKVDSDEFWQIVADHAHSNEGELMNRQPETLTATLTKTDAWGKTRAVCVEWVPEDVTWHDAGMENLGRTIFAFGEPNDPPIRLGLRNGSVEILKNTASFASTFAIDVEFQKTDDVPGPGEFRILSDTTA